MNRERAKALLPIIQAFAEGKAIQFRWEGLNGYNSWNDLPEDERMTVTFPAEDYEYRIKPKPMEIWMRIDAVEQLDWTNVYYDKEHAKKECGDTPLVHFREVTE